MSKTIFQKIINREIPAKILYEDNDVIAIEDINPVAPVHALIIPKKCIETLNDLSEKINENKSFILRAVNFFFKNFNIL